MHVCVQYPSQANGIKTHKTLLRLCKNTTNQDKRATNLTNLAYQCSITASYKLTRVKHQNVAPVAIAEISNV